MDTTIQALIDIDRRAEEILQKTAEAKQTINEENDKRIAQFEAKLSKDTQELLDGKRAENDRIITEEAQALKEKTDARIEELNRYYDAHHDELAGQLFTKITGKKWEA